jgi:menaquinone-specific isochorismate synthase
MSAVLSLASPRAALAAPLTAAIAQARRLGRTTLLTHVEPLRDAPDPLAFLAAGSAVLGAGALWAQPGSGVTFAGAGTATTILADGDGRFGAVSSAIRHARERLIRSSSDDAPFPWIGGFSFATEDDDSSLWQAFPDAMLVVPRVLLQCDGGDRSALLRVTVEVGPASSIFRVENELDDALEQGRKWAAAAESIPCGRNDVRRESIPSREAWEASVATAVALIRQGSLDKVVLAREERLHGREAFDPLAALARLRATDASATLFALQSANDWFLGATPERLVRLDSGRVDVTCLAGSIAMGETWQEREALATRLLASAKDRQEHEIVVASTTAALEEICEEVIRLPGTPRVVAARSVQHLETPLSARLADAGNILDLVERLHPTPAVGGYPRERSLHVIRELETIERGWYAGPFGWTDVNGSGEFAVAIRSALLSGRRAALFAGSGIVADSDPADEFGETCLKLRPMLSALGAI